MNTTTNTSSLSPGTTTLYAIVATILLLLASVFGFLKWRSANAAYAENSLLKNDLVALTTAREKLGRSLDSLTLAHDGLGQENSELRNKIAAFDRRMAAKDAALRNIRNQQSTEMEKLKAETADLQKVKADCEASLQAMQLQLDQLKTENESLKSEVASLKTDKQRLTAQVDDLTKKLGDQTRLTESASFRASAFRVEAERRNDKLTVMARRVRQIHVSFNLDNVPAAYQGAHKIYLVVTDETNQPIHSKNPMPPVVIQNAESRREISPFAEKDADLVESQPIAFDLKLDDRLKKGAYRVAVYWEGGYLGGCGFRLR